jgi:hypothetical protein
MSILHIIVAIVTILSGTVLGHRVVKALRKPPPLWEARFKDGEETFVVGGVEASRAEAIASAEARRDSLLRLMRDRAGAEALRSRLVVDAYEVEA